MKCVETIRLGYAGENEVERHVFDRRDWLALYGPGSFQLVHRRSRDAVALPVAIEADDGIVTWTITSADTAYWGAGEAQLILVGVDGKVKKSQTFQTFVERSLSSGTTPPEPYEGWVEQIVQAAADAENARDAIENLGVDADTLAPGEDATVEKEVDVQTGAVTLIFGLPRGLQGPQGEQGIQGETGPTGPQGPQGIQGPAGAAGATGATGPQGPKGETGETGPQGPAGVGVPRGGTAGQVLAKHSGTDYDTEWVDQSGGGGGGSGEDGATFIPSVSEQGVISWTNDKGLPNPTSRNIMGPQGPTGPQGATGPQGPTGATGPQGPTGATGPAGADGADGADGTTFTPAVSSAGVISWTNDGGKTDPQSVDLVAAVLAALPTWTGGSY